MSLEPSLWSKVHGAFTHFPIALMLTSAFCDGARILAPKPESRRGFRFAGTLTLVLGALASYAAVLSGLVMSRWRTLGHAALLYHHLFVWPGFALMSGLATWRLLAKHNDAERPNMASFALTLLAAMCISAAGYWGGELLNQG